MAGWGAAGDRGKVKIGAGWMTGAVGTTKLHEDSERSRKLGWGAAGGTWGALGDRGKGKKGAGWMTGAGGDRGVRKTGKQENRKTGKQENRKTG